jgi:hypothetical protein
MDIPALNVANMTDWIQIILNPSSIGIPSSNTHLFQIFAAVACDNIWFARNKAHLENMVPNAFVILATINRTILEHHSAWASQRLKPPAIWQKPCSLLLRLTMTQLFGTLFLHRLSSAKILLALFYNALLLHYCLWRSYCCAFCCQLALSLKLSSFILEGDSFTVTLTLQKLEIIQD